jgi:hypothetical protein
MRSVKKELYMNEEKIRSVEDLDAAIAGQAMSKHAELEKAASGESLPWMQVMMILLALLLVIVGLISTAKSELGGELFPAFLGTLSLLLAINSRLEWQLKAYRGLLKLSEQRITRLEKRTFAVR